MVTAMFYPIFWSREVGTLHGSMEEHFIEKKYQDVRSFNKINMICCYKSLQQTYVIGFNPPFEPITAIFTITGMWHLDRLVLVQEPVIGLIKWLRPKGLKVCSYVEKCAELKNQTLKKIGWYTKMLCATEYPGG